jgi:hypothetical protein
MIDRRKAIVGYATYLLARRVARRQIRRRISALRPPRLRDGEDGHMLKKPSKGARAAADRATSLVETVRPIVTRAMHDPQLHDALRQAFATGQEVRGELGGKPPRKAAKKLARDRKLQRKVEASAQNLQKALSNLTERPAKRKGKKALKIVAILGAVGGAAVLVMRRLRGGGGEDEPLP